MKESITTTELLGQDDVYDSITIEPTENNNEFLISYFLKKRDENGEVVTKYDTVKEVIEDDDKMWDGNLENVKHLGYISYRYYMNPNNGFYLNLYRCPAGNPHKGYYKEPLQKGSKVILCSQSDFMGGEKKYSTLELYGEYEIEAIYFSGDIEAEIMRLKGHEGAFESPDFEDINNPIDEMIVTVNSYTCLKLNDKILGEAYDILFGKDDYSDGYKATRMKDVFDEGIQLAASIWKFDKCLTLLRNALKGEQ